MQRADDALREAFDTHRDAWADALDTAQQRADRASRAAVDRLRAEAGRGEIRGARAWLRSGGNKKAIAGPVQSPLKRNLNGDLFTAMELLDGLTAAIETSSVPPR